MILLEKITADKSAENLAFFRKNFPPECKKETYQFFPTDKDVEISSWCLKFYPPKTFLSAEIMSDKEFQSILISHLKF